MLRILLLLVVLGAGLPSAHADIYGDCNQSADPDRRIRGCNAILARGKAESSKNRAIAHNKRALVFQDRGDLKRAIADYDKAIALNSNFGEAYGNRGIAYAGLKKKRSRNPELHDCNRTQSERRQCPLQSGDHLHRTARLRPRDRRSRQGNPPG